MHNSEARRSWLHAATLSLSTCDCSLLVALSLSLALSLVVKLLGAHATSLSNSVCYVMHHSSPLSPPHPKMTQCQDNWQRPNKVCWPLLSRPVGDVQKTNAYLALTFSTKFSHYRRLSMHLQPPVTMGVHYWRKGRLPLGNIVHRSRLRLRDLLASWSFQEQGPRDWRPRATRRRIARHHLSQELLWASIAFAFTAVPYQVIIETWCLLFVKINSP